jgi:hypothetical protein
VDDFPSAYVHSDKAIALYRRLRAEQLRSHRPLEPGACAPADGTQPLGHRSAAGH